MSVDGTLLLHIGEALVAVEIDFSMRHEIVDGETITGTPTVAVLDSNGTTSTALTVSSIVLDSTSSIVQFKVTVVSATEGDEYELKCTVVLSGGATLVECLDVEIEAC